jgi:Predicted nucleic-acid-binding protein containing a Zn-ribbon
MSALAPIAPGLWTDEAEPRLIGARRPDGEIIFPVPDGDAAAALEPVALSRRGTLWSWTTQSFEPKEPYCGPRPFQPFLVGYVELPGEVIVETRIVEAEPTDLEIGMPMIFTIVPFDDCRATYAFRPERKP